MRKSNRTFLANRSVTQSQRPWMARISHAIVSDKHYQLVANALMAGLLAPYTANATARG